nr:cytochrome P450 [Janibacter melonis]
MTVIAELLDWPHADRHLLRPWSQAIVAMYEVGPSEQARAEALRASSDLAASVDEPAAHRARHPGEDLLTDLVQARDAGDALSRHELVATVVLLLNAGHEASVNGLSNGIHSWITAGSPAVDVEDDAALALLAEELLRHDSPLHLFERTATADLEIDGRPVAEGSACTCCSARPTATRRSSPSPTASTAARPNPHLAFGLGIHFCIGAPLARLELQQSVRAAAAPPAPRGRGGGASPDLRAAGLRAPRPRRRLTWQHLVGLAAARGAAGATRCCLQQLVRARRRRRGGCEGEPHVPALLVHGVRGHLHRGSRVTRATPAGSGYHCGTSPTPWPSRTRSHTRSRLSMRWVTRGRSRRARRGIGRRSRRRCCASW